MTNFKLDTKTLFLTIPQISENIDKKIAYDRVMEKYKDKLNSLIISMENHKEEGKHLHLFIEFKSRFQSKLPEVFDFIADKHPNIQSARSKMNVIKYVIKDGDYITYNIDPSNYIKENEQHTKRQSKGDFYELAELIKNGKYSVKEMNDLYPHLFLKYGDHISKYMRFIKNIESMDETEKYYKELYKDIVWSDFQQSILNIINSPVDRRKIHWIYDPKGNNGKSFLANYLRLFHNAYIITGGRSADIYRHYENNKVVIYDLPRDYMNENISLYSTMECFKNGYILDAKYEGQKKSFIPPHIVVLSNNLPDTDKMSKDRWNIINLEEPSKTSNDTITNSILDIKSNTIEDSENTYKILKTQQKLDIKSLKEIRSRTQFTNEITYLNRYTYKEDLRDFYDEFLKEYVTL